VRLGKVRLQYNYNFVTTLVFFSAEFSAPFAVVLRTTPLGCVATGGVAWTASRATARPDRNPSAPGPRALARRRPAEPEEVFGVPHLGRKEVVTFFFLDFMFDQLTGEALVQF
jgi:hypothetical protein